MGLRREWSMLSVFDGYGGETPTSLAVGKIDPPALPKGRRVVVTAGGDAGDGGGARRWGLNTHHGWTIALTDADLAPGDAELKSRKKLPARRLPAHAWATATAWLAVTAEMMKSDPAASSAVLPASVTPMPCACSRTRRPRSSR